MDAEKMGYRINTLPKETHSQASFWKLARRLRT
jgi:hypothetical protein